MNRDVSGPVIDASVELDAALGALRAGAGAVRLAVAPPLDAPAEEGFGPEPKRPLVAELRIGAPDVALDGGAKSAAQSVDVEVEPLAWGGWGGKPFQRFASKVAIVLADGRKLAVSERVVEDEAAAQSAADELAGALRVALGLSEQGLAGSPSEPGDAPAAKPSNANGDDAVRFGIRLEGDRLVLRDYDSRGPREGAGKFRVLALIALALAVLVWARLVGTVRASGELSSLLGLGAIALVLSLGAFAMNEIARHANKYVADSAPLAWFGDDHVVVAPWASLRGAIDLRPEGRYGAAIKIAEVNAVVVRDDQESKAITLETEHGPIDVLYVATDEAAARWRRAVERALVSVAAPQKRAIPLVRASVSASA